MKWIYLSPHFDDVALSCGGLVWEQTQSGDEVSVLTICAGNPPPGPITSFAHSLHERWGTGEAAVSVRKDENLRSCLIMGATAINLSIPDAIYRQFPVPGPPLYESDADLFAGIRSEEYQLIKDLHHMLEARLPESCEIVSPLALGGHVDHLLVRSAVALLTRPTWYYADYPYLIDLEEPSIGAGQGFRRERFPISGSGLDAWVRSIAAHSSQISTFWDSTDQMRSAVQAYWAPLHGIELLYST